MNIQNLRGRLGNVYERLSGSTDYQKNENNLKLIQMCVVTVSAVATGYVNAFAHVKRLGWPWALLLALLVTGFVEKFYFTLRHGLTTTYKNGKQRTYAAFWYRVLQATMVLNATLLFLWIIRLPVPEWLLLYNHYSLAIHFAAALIGVSAVRDADAVVENRMLELKAATAHQDLITARKSAAIGSPLVLIFAKLRGFCDSISIAFRMLFRGGGFAKSYVEEIDRIATEQSNDYFDALAALSPTTLSHPESSHALPAESSSPHTLPGQSPSPHALPSVLGLSTSFGPNIGGHNGGHNGQHP